VTPFKKLFIPQQADFSDQYRGKNLPVNARLYGFHRSFLSLNIIILTLAENP
jgi:hypothetical protein